MKRGDIVLIDFPYTDGLQIKRRPALVVQNDIENKKLLDTVVVLITGNTNYVQEPAQHLVDPHTSTGKSSGLHGPSSIVCHRLFTMRQSLLQIKLGNLSVKDMQAVDTCLQYVLNLQ